jgi:ferritin-like metal-binding protein YciE
MAKRSPIEATLEDLPYQALETEQGGVKIYQTAITCAVNEELGEEWQKHLGETERHVEILQGVLEAFGLDSAARTPSREVVGGIGDALVASMQRAKINLLPEQAEIVACEPQPPRPQ